MNTSLLRASGTAAVFPSLLRNAAGGKADACRTLRHGGPPTVTARRFTAKDPAVYSVFVF
ncbi:MAG: hypothetical protein E5W09_27300 [Mesorhizobium sp.]|nr:MAG: hypothetical protein E5W09_27300 [Mesorhizobium sp.]TKD40632.1 MAG: hypothetical protein E5W98_20580 [Mesorhizobium sp.]